MNNNLLFTMLAASTMMLATGCSSSDDTVATQESNLATVSFSVQADAVVGTRAISDGTGADELIYRVFDKEGHVISASLAKKTETGLTDLLTGHLPGQGPDLQGGLLGTGCQLHGIYRR